MTLKDTERKKPERKNAIHTFLDGRVGRARANAYAGYATVKYLL